MSKSTARYLRIFLWRQNVQPIQDLEAYQRPYYFVNLSELIYFLNYKGVITEFGTETSVYDFKTIKQIIYN